MTAVATTVQADIWAAEGGGRVGRSCETRLGNLDQVEDRVPFHLSHTPPTFAVYSKDYQLREMWKYRLQEVLNMTCSIGRSVKSHFHSTC